MEGGGDESQGCGPGVARCGVTRCGVARCGVARDGLGWGARPSTGSGRTVVGLKLRGLGGRVFTDAIDAWRQGMLSRIVRMQACPRRGCASDGGAQARAALMIGARAWLAARPAMAGGGRQRRAGSIHIAGGSRSGGGGPFQKPRFLTVFFGGGRLAGTLAGSMAGSPAGSMAGSPAGSRAGSMAGSPGGPLGIHCAICHAAPMRGPGAGRPLAGAPYAIQQYTPLTMARGRCGARVRRGLNRPPAGCPAGAAPQHPAARPRGPKVVKWKADQINPGKNARKSLAAREPTPARCQQAACTQAL